MYGGVSSVYIGELDGTISDRVIELQKLLLNWGPAHVAVVRSLELREALIELCSEVLEVAEKENITPMGFDDWEPNLVYPREKRDAAILDAQLERLAERMATNKKTFGATLPFANGKRK